MQLKLALIIILSTSIQLFSAPPVKSQAINEVEIKLALKNEPLLKVFQKIEKQSNFHFMYRYSDVRDLKSPEIPLSINSVEAFLKQILEDTSLSFKQIDDQILILSGRSRKDTDGEINLLAPENKDVEVRGQVRDTTGLTLPGVSVMVKGSNIGTSTDMDGRYSINVPDNAILVFNYIGYIIQEVPVGNQTTINVVLQSSSTSLSEVVVTALGIKREARSLTYGAQGVSPTELSEARNLNLLNTLQGKVAGMTISTAGTGLGGDARVILRGNRSISGDSQPLYVVDGVPISGTISNISPDNIESINVLKGPNAAALYGSAAQDGVIVIETKKGQDGVAQVSLNNTFIAGTPIHALEVQDVYGQGLSGVYNRTLEESWGPKMEGQMVENWSNNPALAGTMIPFSPQPDNFKDIFQTAHALSTSLIATMGNKNTQTAFSYTHEGARGLMASNKLERHDVSLRVNSQLTDWLKMDAKINYNQQGLDNPNTTSDDAFFNPYRNIYRLPRNISQKDLANFEYFDEDGKLKQNYWNPGSTSGKNPYWIMNRLLTLQNQKRVIALASLTFDLAKNLNLMIRSSYDGGTSGQERSVYSDTYGSTYNFGYYSVNKSSSQMWNNDAILSYSSNISRDLSMVALAGATSRTTGGDGSMSANTTQQLNIPNFFSLSNTQVPAAAFTPSAETETQSVYFSGNFGYKNVVFLDVTGRNDWSSTLPATSRSYFYPSVGVSTILTDLIPSLSNLFTYSKVRASWARVGSSAAAYMLSRSVSFGAGGNNGFLTLGAVLPNPELKPERTESIELGLDMRFFNNRLGFDITAYKTNTFDQLFTIALPSGSGAASFYTNGGDVENKGIELVISSTPVQTSRGFAWDLNANFATNRNWVNTISDERPRVVVGSDTYMREFVVEQGKEFGDVYSRGWQRDAQGRVIVGANGLPLITSGRTVKVANYNPDWMGSVTNSISFKNFSASVLIEHRQGGTMVSSTDGVLFGEGVAKGTLAGREGGLVFGDNLFGHETAVLANGSPNTISVDAQTFWRAVGGRNTPVGEAFVQDATNTRVREVTLGYTLPKSLLTKLPIISNVKLSLVGRNLLFLQRSGSWDTEILSSAGPSAEGFQAYVPPTERSIGFNLKIDF